MQSSEQRCLTIRLTASLETETNLSLQEKTKEGSGEDVMGNQGGKSKDSPLDWKLCGCAPLHDVSAKQCLPTPVTCETGNEISMNNNVQEAMQGRAHSRHPKISSW